MSQAAENWVRDKLAAHIGDDGKLELSKSENAERILRITVPVERFAALFAAEIEAGASGLAARMKAKAPEVPDGATDIERAEIEASGLGYDKHIDQWVTEGLLT